MERVFVAGFNWTDIEALARMQKITLGRSLVEQLRVIERLLVKESREGKK